MERFIPILWLLAERANSALLALCSNERISGFCAEVPAVKYAPTLIHSVPRIKFSAMIGHRKSPALRLAFVVGASLTLLLQFGLNFLTSWPFFSNF